MESKFSHSPMTLLRRMFLLVTPNETSFANLEEVPDYVDEGFPCFFGLIAVEWVVLLLQGKKLPRFNDSYSSLSGGLLSLLHGVFFRTVELAVFMWVYERYNIITLPWDSPWTWVLTLLGVDFVYYWLHRFGHEVNFMWAGHQTHHSSEEYNLTTALRQSMVHKYASWMFYIPLALFLPPSIFLVHLQFNLIYQFWVHTETVNTLGPLEWIMSTPSHHRVHHGRNPYCIDKNYGGIFIIWDRMFGTFEAEKKEEKVVYGLVHSIDSWQPLYIQLCHWIHIFKTAIATPGFTNKLWVFLKGPGWSPGTPRLGNPEDIPQVEASVQKYDKSLPLWINLYIFLHFGVVTLVLYPMLRENNVVYTPSFLAGGVAFIVFTLCTFGALYEHRGYGVVMEMIRCVLYVLAAHISDNITVGNPLYWLYVVSGGIWITFVLQFMGGYPVENIFNQ